MENDNRLYLHITITKKETTANSVKTSELKNRKCLRARQETSQADGQAGDEPGKKGTQKCQSQLSGSHMFVFFFVVSFLSHWKKCVGFFFGFFHMATKLRAEFYHLRTRIILEGIVMRLLILFVFLWEPGSGSRSSP